MGTEYPCPSGWIWEGWCPSSEKLSIFLHEILYSDEFLYLFISLFIFTGRLEVHKQIQREIQHEKQESRAVTRKPHDAVFFSV